jgi:hypothetical protein
MLLQAKNFQIAKKLELVNLTIERYIFSLIYHTQKLNN